MSAVPFPEMPDSARVWIFASPRRLAGAEADALLTEVDAFLTRWHAHGQPVVGARDLRRGRFLLVAADEEASGVSGCSIDSLFRALQKLERELGISLLDSSRVWFRERDGEIRCVSRPEFRALADAGEVDGDTIVFNNTVATVGEVLGGEWEVPARASWHAAAFRLKHAVPPAR